MHEQDFYTDPTLFDRCQKHLGRYLQCLAGNLRPYVWTLAFAMLAMVMLSIAVLVLGVLVYQATGSRASSWVQPPAQGVTVLVALLATRRLFGQAFGAWPGHKALPERMRRLSLHLGGSSVPVSLSSGQAEAVEADAMTAEPGTLPAAEPAPGPEAMFLASLRTAGVNAAIARTLYVAGIKSVPELINASDRQLVAIRGVGPASVRKLRAHFGAARD
jgi:hypothetical protein